MAELTRIQTVVFLQSCDLFAYCRADEVLRIAGIAHEQRVAAGDVIYERNGPADLLYGVVQGEVAVRSERGVARTAGPLQTFGVTDLLCGRLRDEDATARTEALLLTIEAEDFFDLLANNIEIVKALFRHLSQSSDDDAQGA